MELPEDKELLSTKISIAARSSVHRVTCAVCSSPSGGVITGQELIWRWTIGSFMVTSPEKTKKDFSWLHT